MKTTTELYSDFLKRVEPQILELFNEEERYYILNSLKTAYRPMSICTYNSVEEAKQSLGEDFVNNIRKGCLEKEIESAQLRRRLEKLASRFGPRDIEETEEVKIRHEKIIYNAMLRDVRENPEKLKKFREDHPIVDVEGLQYFEVE